MFNTAVKRTIEADFTEDDFVRFRNLIRSRSGIYFSDKKKSDLKTSVLKAFHYSGFESLSKYYSELANGNSGTSLFKTLVSFITVGETYFFRHFDVIEKVVIPNLIKTHQHDRTLKIWSAGCSTGEEPYTIAMTLHNLLPGIRDWNITIVGTDINTNSIDYAREGVYRPWSLRSITDYYKNKYFTKSEGLYYLNSEIRNMVKFDYMNLVDENYPLAENYTKDLDIIFCRNVTIYFEAETTIRIVNRFYDCLKEKTYLAVGHAEPSSLIYDKYIAEIYPDAVLYRKDSSLKKEQTYRLGLKTRRDVFEIMDVQKSDGIVPSLNKLEKQLYQFENTSVKENAKKKSQEEGTSVIKETRKKVQIKEVLEQKNFKEKSDANERRTEWNETTLFEKGIRTFHERRFNDAKEIFNEIIEKNPMNGRAYYMLAHISANLDEIVTAKEFAFKAIEKDSLLIEAYYLLGLILKEENVFEESIKMFKKTIYIDSDFALGYYELAVNFFKINDTVQGSRYLGQTSKILQNKKPDDRVGILDELTAKELSMMVQMWRN